MKLETCDADARRSAAFQVRYPTNVGATPSQINAAMCDHGATTNACGKPIPNGMAPNVPAKNPNAVTPIMSLRTKNGFCPTKKMAEATTLTNTNAAIG